MNKRDETELFLEKPKVGDRYTEFYCFWGYVLFVSPFILITIESVAPCEFPKDGNIVIYTRKSFKSHFFSWYVDNSKKDISIDWWIKNKGVKFKLK